MLVVTVLKHWKLIAGLGAILTVGFFSYNAGADSIKAEMTEALVKQQQQYETLIQKSRDQQSVEYDEMLQRVEERVVIQEKVRTVKEYVDRIVETPNNCDDVMLGVGELLQHSTSIVTATRTENTNTE